MSVNTQIERYKLIPISLGLGKDEFHNLKSMANPYQEQGKITLCMEQTTLIISHSDSNCCCFHLDFRECKQEYVCIEVRSNKEFEYLKNKELWYQRALLDFIVNVFIRDCYRPFPVLLEDKTDIIKPSVPGSEQARFMGTQNLEVNAYFYFYYMFKPEKFWQKLGDRLSKQSDCIIDGFVHSKDL